MSLVWPPPQTLHEEHRDFAESADEIRRAADAGGLIPLGELRERICHVYEVLTRQVIPHAMAEDQFPLAQVTGRLDDCPSTSDPLTREHLEIAQLLGELDALRWELAYPTIMLLQGQALRRVPTACTRSCGFTWSARASASATCRRAPSRRTHEPGPLSDRAGRGASPRANGPVPGGSTDRCRGSRVAVPSKRVAERGRLGA